VPHFKVKVYYYNYYDYLMIMGLFSYLQYQGMWVGIKSSDFSSQEVGKRLLFYSGIFRLTGQGSKALYYQNPVTPKL